MPNLEQVVRPAQSPVFRPAARSGTVPIFPDDVVFLWGSSENDVFRLQQTLKDSVRNKRDDIEEMRTFDIVRVKNPDDETQHVDVEVLTGYQSRNQIDKSRSKLRFTPPEGGGNVEILQRNQTRGSSSD